MYIDKIHARFSGLMRPRDRHAEPALRGVSILYPDAPHFQVKYFQPPCKNVTIFQISSGVIIWFIFGYYLVPEKSSTIKRIVAAIVKSPCGTAPLVDGNFNSNLAVPEGIDSERISWRK